MWDFVVLVLIMGMLLAGTSVIIRVGLYWDEQRGDREVDDVDPPATD